MCPCFYFSWQKLNLLFRKTSENSRPAKLKQFKCKTCKKRCVSTSCWDGSCSTFHFKGTPHRVIIIITGHNYIRPYNAERNYRGESVLLSKPSVEGATASCSTIIRSSAEEVVGAEPFPSSALGTTKTIAVSALNSYKPQPSASIQTLWPSTTLSTYYSIFCINTINNILHPGAMGPAQLRL